MRIEESVRFARRSGRYRFGRRADKLVAGCTLVRRPAERGCTRRGHRFGRGAVLMDEVTRVLPAIEQGDAGPPLPPVYDELRKLAARRLAREKPGQTLQATALVHEG